MGLSYSSNNYSTISSALDAAFEYYTTAALGSSYRVYLNTDISLIEPYTIDTTNRSNIIFDLNGFSMNFMPTDNQTYASSPAFIINNDKVKKFTLYSSADETSNQTLVHYSDTAFFGGTINKDSFSICGSYGGNIVVGSSILISATVYGDVISKIDLSFSGANIDGNVEGKSIWLGGSKSTIKGNVVSNGKIFAQTDFIVGGSLSAATQSSGSTAYALRLQKTFSFGGKVNLVGNNSGNTSVNCGVLSIDSTASGTFSDIVTVSGEIKSFLIQNSTFEMGLVNNSEFDYTFDSTDKFGSVFYNNDEFYKNVVTTYGEAVVPPVTPVNDGFTFLGWENENGNIVDFNLEVQNIHNLYYASRLIMRLLLLQQPMIAHIFLRQI